MSEERVTGAGLRAQIEASLAEFEAALAGVSEAERTAPRLAGGWSVKDVLAHVALWHEILLDWLAVRTRGEVLSELAPGYPWGEFDRVNADAHEARKGWTLEEAEDAFRQSTDEVLAALDALDDDALNERWPARNAPVWQWFVWNTNEHYDEHTEMIRQAFEGGG